MLGIRPEHFMPVDDQRNSLPVTVDLVEPLGSDTLIHFDLADSRTIARVNPELRPKIGDRLGLMPQVGKVHLFDSVDGKAIR
ncbi:sn-glycerol-3-phosphate import ATP-binding protein UgpC [compost metagenome]